MASDLYLLKYAIIRLILELIHIIKAFRLAAHQNVIRVFHIPYI